MKYYTALTIAGSDSSGGAGIQADIKTMSALGVYAASAITAVTIQNTKGVYGVHRIQADVVAGQIEAVMDDIHPDAVKIGMVNDAETILAIANTLKKYHPAHIVVDPIMVSTSGSRLMQEDALGIFIDELLPLATLLTPNVPEAEILAQMSIGNENDILKAATRIMHMGCSHVLVKGGHMDGAEKTDYLLGSEQQSEISRYKNGTIITRNTHGTGCTLSSAITAYLAQGMPIVQAVQFAKTFLSNAILAGKDIEIGEGHGPLNHFHAPLPLRIKNNR